MTAIARSHIDGEYRDGVSTERDENPARPSETVAEVHAADSALAAQAATAAASAGASWAKMPAPERGEILRRTGDVLTTGIEQIARDLTREEGKTLPEARGEVGRAIAILRYFAGQTLEPDGDTFPSHSAATLLYARRIPSGVVSVITPWNFPIAIPTWKIAPALAYGNTAVWKPAELVPLTSVHLMNAFVEAGCPPGVLNLVLGKGAELGEVLTTHPSISLITFTGSNTVGRDVQAAGVAANKRVQLEMGGKNPAVVLADADLEHAAEQIARAAFLSAGQKCTATSRVIVETDAEHDLVEYLTERANDWTVGDPLAEQTMIGPLASAAQLARVDAHLRQALDDGAVAAAGGPRHHPDGDGYFASPTVLVGAHDRAPIAQQEIFGPVITVLPAADFERAIALANGTPFGLAASLFTSDLGRALVFTRDARAGVIKVNQETAGLEYQVPFGGMGASSSGSREQGKAAREFFTEWKTVYMDPPP